MASDLLVVGLTVGSTAGASVVNAWKGGGGDLSHAVGDTVKALTFLWTRKVGWSVEMIALQCCHPANGAKRVPWFTEKFQAMKRFENHLEQHWKKTKSELN